MNEVAKADLLHRSVNPAVIETAAALSQRFANAQPFRHVCIDDFFSAETADELARSFPAFDERLAINEDGEVGAKAVHEKIVSLGPAWVRLDELVKGDDFRGLVSRITGIPDLCYDPYYFGGGTHENLHGQGLDAHVDFNFHPLTRQHRRLNLIVYLSEEWRAEWGGSIQLHKDPYLPPAEDEIVTITPAFNRCVIFETNEYSWHGFPRIDLPEDKRHISRRSFALYYYTDTRPAQELGPEHSTIYVDEQLPADWQPGLTLDGSRVAYLRNLLARRDQHLKRLYRYVEQLNTQLNELRELRGDQGPPGLSTEADDEPEGPVEQRLQRLEAKIQHREAELRHLQHRVNELENSTSWKVTAPLRALKRLVSSS